MSAERWADPDEYDAMIKEMRKMQDDLDAAEKEAKLWMVRCALLRSVMTSGVRLSEEYLANLDAALAPLADSRAEPRAAAPGAVEKLLADCDAAAAQGEEK